VFEGVNPYVINKNVPIHVRNPEGEWWSYGSAETSVKISQSPNGITFDRWNRAWVCAIMAEEANLGIYPNGGLFMLYYNGTPVDPINFNWSKIISGETVWSVAMGKNDRLYYLTPTGLNYFDIQSDTNNPVLRENLYPYFPNLSFGEGAELKVDPHGNIWSHSPSQGVHILLENTTSWPDINGLRASNSPLLSDEITDIAFDAEKSLAYIATAVPNGILKIFTPLLVAIYAKLFSASNAISVISSDRSGLLLARRPLISGHDVVFSNKICTPCDGECDQILPCGSTLSSAPSPNDRFGKYGYRFSRSTGLLVSLWISK
jgi:hypothetical protein